MLYEHSKNAFISLFVHFCVDRNEPKNDFREGRYPFPKKPHPSYRKTSQPPRSVLLAPRRNAAGIEPLVLGVVFSAVLTHRKVKCSFGVVFLEKKHSFIRGAQFALFASAKSRTAVRQRNCGATPYGVGFFIVSEILPFLTSTASTQTVTMSPTLTTSSGCFINFPNCEM